MYRDNRKNSHRQGFTLVELMLGMAFVGSLLVVVAVIILQIMGIYNKGLTLKEVNQVSRVVVRDMQQSISSVDAFQLQYKDPDTDSLETPDSYDKMVENATDYYINTAGGRLCTGSYSYAWNTGAALRAFNPRVDEFNPSAPLLYEDAPIQFLSGSSAPIRFIKKSDPHKALCRDDDDGAGAAILPGNAEEYRNVFGPGHNELVVYDFSIESQFDLGVGGEATDITAASSFYYIKMILGTQAGDETISADPRCEDPAGAEYNNGEYCAVNKIDFVARTGGLAR